MKLEHNIKLIKSEKGTLFPINLPEIPFDVKRVFVTYGVPRGEIRGRHAHYETKQFLFCLKGEIEIETIDRDGETNVSVMREGDNYYHSEAEWATIKFLTGEDMMLSLCSTEHNEDDYIRDFNKFREVYNVERRYS